MSLTLMRGLIALAGLIGATGCFPVLAHKTRVEPTFQLSGVMNLALVNDSAGQTGDAARGVVPAIDFEASLGIRDTSRDDGTGLRLSVSAGLSGYGGSAYVELPRPLIGDSDIGLGVAAHYGGISLWTPYIQFGRNYGTDRSWFVRNGVALLTPADSSDGTVVWIPTIGIARQGAYRDAMLFFSAVVGRQQRVERACLFFECFSYSNSFVQTYVMLGASFHFTVVAPFRR